MKLIKPYFEILEQDSGISGVYKAIERAGRLSYKSEDKITEDSAMPFVNKLIKAGHLSCLEHGTIYLNVPMTEWDFNYVYELWDDPYTKYNDLYADTWSNSTVYVTTNYRVIREKDIQPILEYISEPNEHHERRVSVFFNSDIGTMRELFRHRRMSYIQESTRFCNYSNGKFDGEVTFIQPPWLPNADDIDNNTYADLCFRQSLHDAEDKYLTLLKEGWKPEQARNVLPLATKSEAIVTGFVSDWEHIFRLRTSIAETGRPHPQMLELMDPLYEEFIKRNLISKIK